MIVETPEGPAVLLKNLARLDLKPGDRLVVMTDQMLSQATAERISSQLTAAFGEKVIVISDGLKLAVLGAAA